MLNHVTIDIEHVQMATVKIVQMHVESKHANSLSTHVRMGWRHVWDGDKSSTWFGANEDIQKKTKIEILQA